MKRIVAFEAVLWYIQPVVPATKRVSVIPFREKRQQDHTHRDWPGVRLWGGGEHLCNHRLLHSHLIKKNIREQELRLRSFTLITEPDNAVRVMSQASSKVWTVLDMIRHQTLDINTVHTNQPRGAVDLPNSRPKPEKLLNKRRTSRTARILPCHCPSCFGRCGTQWRLCLAGCWHHPDCLRLRWFPWITICKMQTWSTFK